MPGNNSKFCLYYKIGLMVGLLFLSKMVLAENIRPQDDFNLHINGAWYEKTQIPPSKVSAGSFEEAGLAMEKHINKLFDKLLAQSEWPEGSDEAAVVSLYQDWLDWPRRNALDLKPLAPALEKFESIQSAADLFDVDKPYETLVLLKGVFDVVNRTAIYEDGSIAPHLDVDMPLLAQYDFEGEDSPQVQRFENLVLHAYKRLGDSDPKQATADFMQLTRKKAQYLLTSAEQRKLMVEPNVITLTALAQRFPSVPLAQLMQNLNQKGYEGTVYYGNEKSFNALDVLLVETPVNQLKRYLKALYYINNMQYLAREDYDAYMNLYIKPSMGLEKSPDETKIAKEYVISALPSIMGQLYIQDNFSVESQALFAEMVMGLKAVLAERIKALTWMSDPTRKEALEKLEKTIAIIGQAKSPTMVDKALLKKTYFFETVNNIATKHLDIYLGGAGEKFKADEYFQSVLIIDAFNDFSNNLVFFPVGILNKPFYDEKTALKDKAHAYGAIGIAIGHELTHSFDDQGSQLDKGGIKRNWWTKEDKENFKKLGEKLVSFYNKETYTVAGKQYPVNGSLTLGENIADFGGLNIAYDAYRRTDEFKKGELVNGKTPSQRFFEAYANLWRYKARPEQMLNKIKYDMHSPFNVRINAPLKNMQAFQETYKVKPKDGMYLSPSERIEIW